MKNKNTYLLLFLIPLILSCTKTKYDEYIFSAGNADFSNYISLGDSYTQGFQDGGLHNEFGQQDNSYPAIIAKQMRTSFIQPTVTGSGSGYMHLVYRNGEITVIKDFNPKITNNDPEAIGDDPSFVNWADTAITYNNLAIGGINLRDVLSLNGEAALHHVIFGEGASANLSWNGVAGEPLNPYGRFLNWGTTSNKIEYISHIINSKATFFTNWLGINDVMSWAKEGGDDISGFAALTDITEFRTKYDSVLTVLQQMGAKGVCANIQDITQSPFFNTITLSAVGKDIWIKEGADTTVIRKATTEDLILLSALDYINAGTGLTQANPLPHQQVLDKAEVTIVKNYTNNINAQIEASATSHGFYVVDMNTFISKLNSGLTFDGVDLSAKYIEGGAYSLDGLHPNTKGYAMIANEFIKSINTHYNATLQPVAIADYSGIIFP